MKRLSWWLIAMCVGCWTMETFGQGPAFWATRDTESRGRLERMIGELKKHQPATPVRCNIPLETLAKSLEQHGRFRELGLSKDDGRALLRAVYQHLGLNPSPAPAKQWNERTAKSLATLPGYRPRGEFEPIGAVLMTWPDSPSLVDEFIEIIRTIHAGDAWVYFYVRSPLQQRFITRKLTEAGIDQTRIHWIKQRLNSMWMRDYGPVFVYDEAASWAVADFHYYRQRPADDRTPSLFASSFGVPLIDRQSRERAVYTEGGNLMTDGLGTIVYSSRTYENNRRTDPSVIDSRIGSALQASKSFVPDPPSLDGTGHVDMFMKIIGPNRVLIGQYQPGQPDYQVLEDCAALFANGTNGAGQPWQVIRVPMPDVYYAFFALPVVRTYINGLMVNDQVIIPTYGIPEDDAALSIIRNALPGRTIVPINANQIIESAGAWHCVLMEFPQP